MLRLTPIARVRCPKARRPPERPWEVYNTRNFGIREGAQNYRTWVFGTLVCMSVTSYEIYQYWLRLCARGDTCSACESIREQRRLREKLKEKSQGM